jgi:hypothetical protein
MKLRKQYRKYVQEHRDRMEEIAKQKPGYSPGLLRWDDPRPRHPQHGDAWGPWWYNAHNLTLECGTWECYYVDLERCGSAGQTLDWIFQIAGKNWATAEVIGHLVEALDDLLEPQANLCSFGSNKTMNVRQFLKARKQPKAAA